MGVCNIAALAQCQKRRLAAELQELPRLAERAQDLGRRGHPPEWNLFFFEVALKGLVTVWTERDHLDAARADLRIAVSELSKLLAAEGSEEAAQKDDKYGRCAAQGGRSHLSAAVVPQRELGYVHLGPPY